MIIRTQSDPWKRQHEIPIGHVAHCSATRTQLFLDGLIISQPLTSRVRPSRDKPGLKIDHLRSKEYVSLCQQDMERCHRHLASEYLNAMVVPDVTGRYGKRISEPFLQAILRHRIASMSADMRLVSYPMIGLQEPVISSPTCLSIAEVAAGGI